MHDGKHIMLYFGSFNPIHKAHIAIAEYVVSRGLADMVVLVVSPQNPFKEPEGLAPEFSRFEMAEMAAAASAYPGRIQVSAVEMTLPKPSYTINTLRFLATEFPDARFSILMGGDNVENLSRWRDADEILAGYDIYVYPRPGEKIAAAGSRMTVLKDAPLFDISSTEVREAVARGENIDGMVPMEVADYIHENRLWS